MFRRTLSLTFVCVSLLAGGCSAQTAPSTKTAPDTGTAAGSTAPSPSADPTGLALAAVAATGRTTARTTHKTEMGAGTGQTHVISGKGVHDFSRHRGTTTVSMASAARFEEVFADGKVYLRGRAGAETMPWSYVERDEVEARHILRAPANDPEYTLEQAAMAEKFHEAGKEKLGGAPTTRYRGTLPYEALTLEMADERRKGTGKLRDMLGGEIPVYVDVWVDRQGRATQIRMSLQLEAVSSVSTLTLTELGKPVKVTVPTAEAAEPGESGMGILG